MKTNLKLEEHVTVTTPVNPGKLRIDKFDD